jgi:hypothetical protein
MSQTRRKFLQLAALASTGLFWGCANTKRLFEPKRYTEKISSILISADGKKIVAMGPEYHYIFDAPPEVVQTIKSGFHKAIQGSLSSFKVDAEGSISGSFFLRLNNSATESEKQEAFGIGYRQIKTNFPFEIRGTLNGIRYSAGGQNFNSRSEQLNRTYSVDIFAEHP